MQHIKNSGEGSIHLPSPPPFPLGLNHFEFLENIVSLSGRLQFEHKATQNELLLTEKTIGIFAGQ